MSTTKKDAKIQAEKIIRRILKDEKYLSELLKGIIAKEDSVRYPNALALENLSINNPKMIYPQWEVFTELLKSKNAYHRSIAISTISNLSIIDDQNKFEKIFEEFFKLIDDNSVIVIRKLAIYAGRIAKAKPLLRSKITNILLDIDNTQHISSHKDLIKGDIIESFSEYFKDMENKNEIIKFVKNQLKSSSPSTVKKAKNFLSKWEN
ncbi:MAG: hypothetical protein ACFFDF_10910 [Candidatus Odinarchaeota archaeon]